MPLLSPLDSETVVEGTRSCAGRGCRNTGTNLLEILYINKVGWFCNSCKSVLLAENLVVEEDPILQQKEIPEILLLKETAGSKTHKIAEPATDDNGARTTTQDHIQGRNILQHV